MNVLNAVGNLFGSGRLVRHLLFVASICAPAMDVRLANCRGPPILAATLKPAASPPSTKRRGGMFIWSPLPHFTHTLANGIVRAH